ncbi:glycosyltransferase [Desulfosporosinus sp. SB140]|uniref:glycosyltransferase n=1 Tax=Desulfosporosinus paludis TaxID=3115649 RepID=UPI00388E8DB9
MEFCSNRLTLVIGLFGRYEILIKKFNTLIKELQELEQIELIFVADGENWTTLPTYQVLPILFKNAKFIETKSICDLPAKLFNMGLEAATGKYVTFVYPGCKHIPGAVKIFLDQELNQNVYAFQVALVTGIKVTDENRYGFLQALNCYSSMDLFVRTEFLKSIGGFNPSKSLQADFMQELTLRLSKDQSFKDMGIFEHEAPSFEFYSFHRKIRLPKDIINRYIIRNSRPAFPGEAREEIAQDFMQDLKEEDAARFSDVTGIIIKRKELKYRNKYKITVLGGYWEYHHNQICFFNYFENLSGLGFCTYKSCLDELATEEELETSDLVIFTRCRSDNALNLIDFCKLNGIPTIYMIDDNWISIAKDHPKYGSIFVKGNPNYDNFIKAIGKCKTTWTFNDKLIEDIAPYARNITKFFISVEPKLFDSKNQREKSDKFFVGFSGSLRYDDIPFRALAEVARQYNNICVVLCGILSKEQKQLFDGLDVVEIPFLSYSAYAKNISKLSPDVLLAPILHTRTSMSKCYNKYVESSIVKAVCIYSKVEPYTTVVKDGENGYFVEAETVEGWRDKIEEVLTNPGLLRQVQSNAYRDVMENHTVGALLGEFVNTIDYIVKAEDRIDD